MTRATGLGPTHEVFGKAQRSSAGGVVLGQSGWGLSMQGRQGTACRSKSSPRSALLGNVGPVVARQARFGPSRQGVSRHRWSRQARLVPASSWRGGQRRARTGAVRLGSAWPVRRGNARQARRGPVLPGPAGSGTAWRIMALQAGIVLARSGMARPGSAGRARMARHGAVRRVDAGWSKPGVSRIGSDRSSRLGMAGKAPRGVAVPCKAKLRMARIGEAGQARRCTTWRGAEWFGGVRRGRAG